LDNHIITVVDGENQKAEMAKVWDCFPFIRMFENFHNAVTRMLPDSGNFPLFPIMPDMSSAQKVAIYEYNYYRHLLYTITGVHLAPKGWSRECCLYVQKTLDGEEELPKNRCRSVLNYWKNKFKKERQMKKKLTEANCKVEIYFLENGRLDMEKAEKALVRAAKPRKIG
jgi:hypothetical protein